MIVGSGNTVTVIKRNLQGEETWRYSGRVITRQADNIVLEAFFNHPDKSFYGLSLNEGDRFVETYYIDRWYNIYEIHDRSDDHLKGWYCNIGSPATIKDNIEIVDATTSSDIILSYTDLALDLLIYPDGRQLIRDEDEFLLLPLTPQVQVQALLALEALQQVFRNKFKGQA